MSHIITFYMWNLILVLCLLDATCCTDYKVMIYRQCLGAMFLRLLMTYAVLLQIKKAESYVRCYSQKADVHYILDASGSISYPDWKLELAFVNKVNRAFTINRKHVQVSVTVFDSHVQRKISFTQYDGNQKGLHKAIRQLVKTNGGTNTAAALDDARIFSFTEDNGARCHAAKIAIIITDGVSDNARDTLNAAIKLKQSGVVTIAVGVGSGINYKELQDIASSPKHVFTVKKFHFLRRIAHKIAKIVCRAKKN